MCKAHRSSLVTLCVGSLLLGCVPVLAQSKLSSDTALVLTQEFCATKTKKGTWGINQEVFKIGEAACQDLEPALKSAFSRLTRVDTEESAGAAQLIAIPKFVDIGATQKMGAFSNRELVVIVEWTIKNKLGKTVWVDTIQGSAKHHQGNMWTHNKNLKRIVADSVKNMAEQSASKMLQASELRQLTAGQ